MYTEKTITPMRSALAAMILSLLVPAVAWAQSLTPAGLWKNIDEATDMPRAMIRISQTPGGLQGKIEQVFPKPGEGPNPKCVKCEGANRNAPVVGLIVMDGLQQVGGEYVGGWILDPDSGSTYRSKVKLLDNGQKLSVRGYIGLPALGRTQTWIRVQ